MILEYANKDEHTQELLKPMTLTLIMMLARQFRMVHAAGEEADVISQMVRYMDEHLEHVTLAMLAAAFGYHPSYISARLSKRTGRSFSQILLSQRMERALLLMRTTDLSIEEIAPMLGYSDKSNFHKAFRAYYGMTPRQYLQKPDPTQI